MILSAILRLDFIILHLSNSETRIQQEIRLALGQRSDLRLFRNETGKLPDPRTGRWVQFGLAKGSSDLIGFKTIKVTPEMVGKDLAVFCSVEVKTNTGQLSKYQHNWLQVVKNAGGIVGVDRNVRDAFEILKLT